MIVEESIYTGSTFVLSIEKKAQIEYNAPTKYIYQYESAGDVEFVLIIVSFFSQTKIKFNFFFTYEWFRENNLRNDYVIRKSNN